MFSLLISLLLPPSPGAMALPRSFSLSLSSVSTSSSLLSLSLPAFALSLSVSGLLPLPSSFRPSCFASKPTCLAGCHSDNRHRSVVPVSSGSSLLARTLSLAVSVLALVTACNTSVTPGCFFFPLLLQFFFLQQCSQRHCLRLDFFFQRPIIVLDAVRTGGTAQNVRQSSKAISIPSCHAFGHLFW